MEDFEVKRTLEVLGLLACMIVIVPVNDILVWLGHNWIVG